MKQFSLALLVVIGLLSLMGAVSVPVGGGGTTGTWENVAYVDATNGSDADGELGRIDKPYATIDAAQDAALAAGGSWLIHIRAGAYTDTGLLPGDADSTLAYHYDPNTTHTITGAGHLYNWTGDHTGKRLFITGRCCFGASGVGTTGHVIDTVLATTVMRSFHIECQEIRNYNGRPTGMLDLQGDTETFYFSEIFCHGDLIDENGGSCYFRINNEFIHIHANWIDGIDTDGTSPMVIHCGYGQDFEVSKNGFSPGAMEIVCDYRLKGTDEAAVVLRYGTVVLTSPKLEMTGQNSADDALLLIPSNAVTNSAGDVRFTINGGRARMWESDTPGTFIHIAKDSDNIEGRVKDVVVMMEDSASTECITAVGTQDIDLINFTSNLPLDSNVTGKVGPITIDPDLKTDF